jgi:putative transposase
VARDLDDGSSGGDEDWFIAVRRAEVVRRFLKADGPVPRSELIATAAAELAVSRPTVYRLLARFRAAEVTSAIMPARRGRPRGSQSLDQRREAIISREISRFYLKQEQPRLSGLVDRIGARCRKEGLSTPDWRTVCSRVRSPDAELVARKRQDRVALARVRGVSGEFSASHPLKIVEIDHTQVVTLHGSTTTTVEQQNRAVPLPTIDQFRPPFTLTT